MTPLRRIYYVAGHYRKGDVAANIAAARRVAIEIWKLGHAAICPHLNTQGFESDIAIDPIVSGDLAMIDRSNGVVMLPGWETSDGAVAEHDFANERGIPVWYYPDMPPAARGQIFIGIHGVSGAGKTELAIILERSFGFCRRPFAEPLKVIAAQCFGWDGKKDERGRRLLQVLGTDAGRDYDTDIWVKRFREEVVEDPEIDRVVADDIRFTNEADLIRELGGTLVRVDGRGGLSGANAQHISEHAVLPCDATIDNSGSLDDLAHKAADLMARISP